MPLALRSENVPEDQHAQAGRRDGLVEHARQVSAELSDTADPFPSAEEMQREDRLR